MGIGIVTGLVGMGLTGTASFGIAEEPLQLKMCDGVERILCSEDATNRFDVVSAADTLEEGTLRWAIERSNTTQGIDEIVIDSSLEIDVVSDIVVEEGIILRGSGADGNRPKIRALEGDGSTLLDLNGAGSSLFVVQIDGIDFENESSRGAAVRTAFGSRGLGVFDTRVSGFEMLAIDVIAQTGFEYFVVSDSEVSDTIDGYSAVRLVMNSEPVQAIIRDSMFMDNEGTAVQIENVGGDEVGAYSNLSVTGSTFLRNGGDDARGGAIVLNSSTLTLDQGESWPYSGPMIRIAGNHFEENRGFDAGAIRFNSVGLQGGFAEPQDLILLERSSFVNNVSQIGANDISLYAFRTSHGAGPDACSGAVRNLHIMNSTMSNESSQMPSVSLDYSECADVAIDHSTFVGAGISAGVGNGSELLLRNTIIDSGDAQPIVSTNQDAPFTIREDHVAYTTAPDAVTDTGVAGNRIVASSEELALGDLQRIDTEADGVNYTAAVYVPGAILGAEPAAVSKLVDAGVALDDSRLLTDQRGVGRPLAGPERSAALADIGAVEAVFENEGEPEVPVGPEDPEDPEVPGDPEKPVAPVDPVTPTDPAQTKPDAARANLANTGSSTGAMQWFAFGGILVLAGGALVAGRRLQLK